MRKHGDGLRAIANDPDRPKCSTPITSISGGGNKPGICTFSKKVNWFANELARFIFKALRAANSSFNGFG